MKLATVLAALQQIAPEHLAEGWDQVGLHLAGNGKQVRKAMLCIDLTPAVLDEAIACKCQLIVAYHPPIFRPLTRLADRDWKERMLAKAVRAGLAVYSPHTSLDAVRDGMNDWLCDGLGAHTVRWSIGVPRETRSHRYKVAVVVPRASADAVRNAMCNAGAATRTPSDGGSSESVSVEAVCWRDRLGDIVAAVRNAHPHDDPSADVVELACEPEPEEEEQTPGRCMHLRRPISAELLVRRVKRHLKLKRLKVAIPSAYGDEYPGQIGSVAACVGAGGSLFEKYMTADAYITGEMQHHQVLDMVQRGKVVILTGHTNSERPFLNNYRDAIIERCGTVEWVLSAKDIAPLETV